MDLIARGLKSSPILIVGDSLPKSEDTRNKLDEILDRRGVTYNSIIIPLKYYINEYLISKYRKKLPFDLNNREDIFRFVNALDDPGEKMGLDGGSEKLNNLKYEIFNKNEDAYEVILCMGDFAFFAVRSLFNKYNPREKKHYPRNGSKYTIERLGTFFGKNIKIHEKGKPIILPILHNSSNLHFSSTVNFIPVNKRLQYISYMQYIAEEIGELMMKNTKMEGFLCSTANREE